MKRHFVRTSRNEARFLVVLDHALQMRRMQAKLGKLESQSAEQQVTPEEREANIAQALKHGFREVSEQEFFDQQRASGKELAEAIVEAALPGSRFVDWHELSPAHGSLLRNNPSEFLTRDMQKFVVFDGPGRLRDLRLSFDSLGATPQTTKRNLVFNSSLSVEGNLDAGDFTTELPLFVLVKGDLHVRNLVLTGWTEIVVMGNVVATGTVMCLDGEAGGRLHVQDSLQAERILGGSMYSIVVDGQTKGTVYWTDDDHPTLPGAVIVPVTLDHDDAMDFGKRTSLTRETYTVDSNWATGTEVKTYVLDPVKLVDQLRRGVSPFSRDE